jgi:formylglycine-generating enzyme
MMLRTEHVLGIVVMAFLGAACFSPAYEQPRCSPLGECPSGLTCVAEVCVKDPTADEDAGPDGAMADAPPMIDAPPASVVPSCAPARRTCGAGSSEDCCAALPLPSGTFARGFDPGADNRHPAPGSAATLSAFRLDKFEISVGRFRAFVNAMKGTQADPPAAGSGAHAAIADSGWQSVWNANLPANQAALSTSLNCSGTATWTAMPGANENKPINCINWYVAMAFCIWDGGYLPTEAEWHYAGSGGGEQRAYPWSVPAASLTIDPTYAAYNCLADGQPTCAATDILPVGSLPKGNGRWGQADLGGNVAEWTLDGNSGYPTPCTNCSIPHSSTMIFRGGSYDLVDPERAFRPSYRIVTSSTVRTPTMGARCARAMN